MGYYIVKAKCGHLGRNRYIPIEFAIEANNAKDAATIARELPRVKTNHKYAIISVKEVSEIDYQIQFSINSCDPYLKVKSRYEQNKIMDLIISRVEYENKTMIKKTKRESVKYRRKKEYVKQMDMEFQMKQFC